ncbi:unnamed protein product [Prorocentrum cordatum]|uniref:Uncharacterized protein n=1 Tax=Prorocentrum cordatum TaxID=2364126 RepID=A0ABN9PVJ6_9DINO|nr:unnamed protein product [Polarella glacialis]
MEMTSFTATTQKSKALARGRASGSATKRQEPCGPQAASPAPLRGSLKRRPGASNPAWDRIDAARGASGQGDDEEEEEEEEGEGEGDEEEGDPPLCWLGRVSGSTCALHPLHPERSARRFLPTQAAMPPRGADRRPPPPERSTAEAAPRGAPRGGARRRTSRRAGHLPPHRSARGLSPARVRRACGGQRLPSGCPAGGCPRRLCDWVAKRAAPHARPAPKG